MKTENLLIRLSPEEKSELENIASYFKLSMSDLVRKAVLSYAKNRHAEAFDALWKRMARFLGELRDNKIPKKDVDSMREIIGAMPIPTLETFADPELVDDATFKEFMKAKITVAERELVHA